MIHSISGKAFKGSDVNRSCHSIKEGSLEITFPVPSTLQLFFSVSVGYTQSSTTASLPAPLTAASLPAPAAASVAAPSKSAAPSPAVRPVS